MTRVCRNAGLLQFSERQILDCTRRRLTAKQRLIHTIIVVVVWSKHICRVDVGQRALIIVTNVIVNVSRRKIRHNTLILLHNVRTTRQERADHVARLLAGVRPRENEIMLETRRTTAIVHFHCSTIVQHVVRNVYKRRAVVGVHRKASAVISNDKIVRYDCWR